MNSKTRRLLVSPILVGILAVGCAAAGVAPVIPGRSPSDAPERFQVSDAGQLRDAVDGEGCRNPLVDPRDRTEIRLVRSAEGLGDYTVPEGRYSVGPKEVLRVRCATGEIVGIARASR